MSLLKIEMRRRGVVSKRVGVEELDCSSHSAIVVAGQSLHMRVYNHI
jgi:hypothetical protein